MVNVKENTDFSSNEDKIETGNAPQMTRPTGDVVVNVDFCEYNKIMFMRFDVLSITGDDGRYYSIIYDLSTKHATNGLFDFFDDYYSKRFSFFSSNKRIQALCIALWEIEEKFYKETGFNFKEYTEAVIRTAVEKATTNELSIFSGKLTDGYTVGLEASKIYKEKQSAIGASGNIEKIGKLLKKCFDKCLKKINDKKFCCIGINNTPKLPPSFIMDPIVGLPLIIFDVNYISSVLKNCFKSCFENDVFKIVGIDTINIDLWGVGDDLDIKTLMNIVGEDGEFKGEYEKDAIEELDMFLGKYKTIHLNKNLYNNDGEQTNMKSFV